MEMKRKWRLAVPLAAIVLFAGACSDGNIAPAPIPTFGAVLPGNDIDGQCLGDDIVQFGDGFFSGHSGLGGDPTKINCTANDIEIARADASAFFDTVTDQWVDIAPGEEATCVEGQPVTFKMILTIVQNSNAVRGDIGLWIGTDGKLSGAPSKSNPGGEYGGLTGQCNHYNIPAQGVPIVPPLENADGDQCAGMLGTKGAEYLLDIGEITVPCTPNESNRLQIAGCSAWNVPGGDFVCPAPGVNDGANGFRVGTMPNNSSKCKCDPFEVPIVVAKEGLLEVKKTCSPTNDGGKFNLQVDGTTRNGEQSCGGTTTPQVVDAGTSSVPGAIHTFGETGGSGPTDLANYNSSYQCTLNNSESVINQCGAGGNAACTGTSTGPNQVNVLPDQHIVCTFHNERKAQLRVAKVTVPSGDAQVFTFTPTGWNSGNTFTRTDGQAAFASGNLNPNTYSVVETVPSGWELTGRACVLTGTATVKSHTNIANGVSVNLLAGEDVTCTFTNTKQAQLRIEKITIPDGDLTDFTFTPSGWNGGNTFTRRDNQAAFASGFLSPNANYTTTETVPDGWDLTARACRHTVGGAAKTHTNTGSGSSLGIQVNLLPGEDITCAFTNTKRATVTLAKREQGGLPLTRQWTFEMRTGASTLAAGTVRATGTAVLATGVVDFSCDPNPNANCVNVGGIANFVPGAYQLCETGMPAGWSNNFDGFTPDGANPEGADNSTECIDVTLAAGGAYTTATLPGLGGLTFIDNTPPPGGDNRTIGYWRNHASCSKSGGRQYDRLVGQGDEDKTLDYYLSGAPSSALYPLGDITSLTCQEAVNLVSKRDKTTGQIRANDAAYALASQLIAAKINTAINGAPSCVQSYLAAAQTLLGASAPNGIDFTGTGSYLTASSGLSVLRNKALAYADVLDRFNNNDPAILANLCPALP
jgi:hypothetical protein